MEVLTWFLLEALAAAGLLALVVWWTWPRKRKSAKQENAAQQDNARE